MTLDEIAIKHGTDKSSKGHSYCQYYDMMFSHLRDKEIRLFEIGVDKGDSLLMWAEYFPKGIIVGADIREDYEYLLSDRISTILLDQSNKADLLLFGEANNNTINIIIDDGSHQSADMILSFETLFPYLKCGGYYVIEDLLCDYDSRWNKGASVIDRVRQMVGEVNMNGAIPNDHICANKQLAVTKYFRTYWDSHIEWIFAACGTVIIKKV